MSLAVVNAKEDVEISLLFMLSSSSSPRAVFGASNRYFTPESSIDNSKLPTPYLLLARTPLSSL
jgi:hypothetical protein